MCHEAKLSLVGQIRPSSMKQEDPFCFVKECFWEHLQLLTPSQRKRWSRWSWTDKRTKNPQNAQHGAEMPFLVKAAQNSTTSSTTLAGTHFFSCFVRRQSTAQANIEARLIFPTLASFKVFLTSHQQGVRVLQLHATVADQHFSSLLQPAAQPAVAPSQPRVTSQRCRQSSTQL